eukprot:2490793-Pyramimonas_sp.AAC.2
MNTHTGAADSESGMGVSHARKLVVQPTGPTRDPGLLHRFGESGQVETLYHSVQQYALHIWPQAMRVRTRHQSETKKIVSLTDVASLNKSIQGDKASEPGLWLMTASTPPPPL